VLVVNRRSRVWKDRGTGDAVFGLGAGGVGVELFQN
jgi:hypothetical protein